MTITNPPLGPATVEPQVHLLGPDELATLRALAAALVSDQPVRAAERALEGALDDVAQALGEAVELNWSIRNGSRALAQAAVTGPDSATLTDARLALEAAIGEHSSGRPDRRALEQAALAIREAGLEAHDADLVLATRQDGTRVIVRHPVPPETAHVWLLESLYDHVETTVLLDPLLELERQASAWWFERWTPPPGRQRPDEMFPRGVREQEWSLVERTTLCLGLPVMTAHPEHPVFDELPPRQQAMARALPDSFAGVFRVRERRGTEVTLEDIAGGEHYRVHEHNEAITYHPGYLALGRLIPFGPGRYLRSPGMTFLALPDPTLVHALGGQLEQSADELGPAIAVEICISMLLGTTGLPRKVRATTSKAEARNLLRELQETLEEAGLARRVTPGRVSAELKRLGQGKQLRYYEYDLDDTLAQWFHALSEQAGRPSGKRRG